MIFVTLRPKAVTSKVEARVVVVFFYGVRLREK